MTKKTRILINNMEEKSFLSIQNGIRADVFVAEKTGFTRSYVKKLFDEQYVSINNKIEKGNKKLKEGDKIVLLIPEKKDCSSIAVDMPLDIVYQDEDIAIINKPQGLTVHAGSGTNENTLVNALLFHLDNLSGINGVLRPGIVHRIDKNTSGLLIVAKNDKAHLSLAKQLENKTCNRTYIALLEGELKTEKGHIETFIARDVSNRTKMAVSKNGRIAITDYKVIKVYSGYTLCQFNLKTGRTHQIRVHAKHLGHPVVGDKEYGYKNQKFKLNGQLLHAFKLEFIHPSTGEKVTFTADIPKYFQNVLNKLKNKE